MTTTDAIISIDGLCVDKGGKRILSDVTVEILRNSVVGIIGPNGAGKSTLLGCLFGHTTYKHGQIRLNGQDLRTLPRRDAARIIAAVPQDSTLVFDVTVEDIVAAGRIPHTSGLGTNSADDQQIIDRCLRRVNLESLRSRSAATLSGGERQRALLGRALAQACPVLILDEPTNHLDLHNQEQLLGLIREHDGTTVVAIHDLNLAAEYCDHIIVMAAGTVVTTGPPEQIITPDLLRDVFGVRAHVVPHPESGRPHLITSSSRIPADR